jgi:uncharacterized RDD family membrane protein YckC
MSSTPPEAPGPPETAPIPPGYQPGDYVPFKDRDPSNPSAIAGQWADPARQAQVHGHQGDGRPMTAQERYRAIYGSDAPVRVEFASWGRRVLGYLVDTFIAVVVSIPLFLGYKMLLSETTLTTDVTGQQTIDRIDPSSTTIAVLVLGGLMSLVINLYNTIIRQGRTGYSFGKTVVGIRLVKASTMEPMGAVLCFVRQLAHYVDSLLCYLGWFWPLWDRNNQTLADKIMGTVVVIQAADELG